MRKIVFLFLIFAFGVLCYSQTITNVRIDPVKSSYLVGSAVKIYWNFSDIDPSEKVKITVWKEGATQNSCRIAQDVPINRGTSGFDWVIKGKCTNPRTGVEETLSGRIKIRVRWQGHSPAVFGESPYFTLYYTDEGGWEVSYPAQVAPGFLEVSNARMTGENLSYDSSYLSRDTYEFAFFPVSTEEDMRLPIKVLVDNLRDKELEGRACVVRKGIEGRSIRFWMASSPNEVLYKISPHGWKIVSGGDILLRKDYLKTLCGFTTTLVFEVFAHDKDISCREVRGTQSKKKTLKVKLQFPPCHAKIILKKNN